MVLPNLLHPVDIVIEKVDRASTVWDEDAREAVQQLARAAAVTVDGQVKWARQVDTRTEKAGRLEESRGYVLFRYVDLAAAGITIEEGDRFTSIGGIAKDVYVEELEPTGHWQDQGGPTMVKAYFADRQPSRR